MYEKLTKASELCDELAETLSPTPDAVQVTVKIPHSGDLGTTTVTDEQIAQMAAGELFRLERDVRARIELEDE